MAKKSGGHQIIAVMLRGILLLACLSLFNDALSQEKFAIQLDIGVASAGTRKQSILAGGVEVSNPVVSATYGLILTKSISTRFSSTLGAQYSIVGQRYTYDLRGYDMLRQSDFINASEELFKFSQLSVPITIGYLFEVGNIGIVIACGYKFSYNLSGNYRYLNQITYMDGTIPTVMYTKKVDPFDSKNEIPANRTISQIGIELTSQIKSRFSIHLEGYQPIQMIYFKERQPPATVWDDPTFHHRYNRINFGLSLRWKII